MGKHVQKSDRCHAALRKFALGSSHGSSFTSPGWMELSSRCPVQAFCAFGAGRGTELGSACRDERRLWCTATACQTPPVPCPLPRLAAVFWGGWRLQAMLQLAERWGERAIPCRAMPCRAMGRSFPAGWLSRPTPVGSCSPGQPRAGQPHPGTAAAAAKRRYGSGGKAQALFFGASPSVSSPWGGVCHFKRGQK